MCPPHSIAAKVANVLLKSRPDLAISGAFGIRGIPIHQPTGRDNELRSDLQMRIRSNRPEKNQTTFAAAQATLL